MESDPLQVRFIRARALPSEKAADLLLRGAVPPVKRPLFLLLDAFSPDLFRVDREVVSDVLRSRSVEEVHQAITYMHSRMRRPHNFFRDVLGIRISGQRLLRLALHLFEK